MKNVAKSIALASALFASQTGAQSLNDTTKRAVADVTFPGEGVSVGIHTSDKWGSGTSMSLEAGGEIDGHEFRFHGDAKVLHHAQDVFLSV